MSAGWLFFLAVCFAGVPFGLAHLWALWRDRPAARAKRLRAQWAAFQAEHAAPCCGSLSDSHAPWCQSTCPHPRAERVDEGRRCNRCWKAVAP